MNELKQKRFFDTRAFCLNDSSIKVTFKNLKKSNEVEIDYDFVTGKMQKTLDGSVTTYIIMRIAFILMTLSLFAIQVTNKITYKSTVIFALIGVVSLIIYYLSRNDFLKIDVSDNQYIYIHRTIPSKKIVTEFVQTLTKKRNHYLKEKFLKFDKLLSYEDQHKNLVKLLDFKVIDKSTFEIEEKKLKQLFGNIENPKNIIGFNLN